MKINIDASFSEAIERAKRTLGEADPAMRIAASRAMNRSITAARAQAVRHTRENYTMRAKTVRDSLKISRSSVRNMQADMTSRGELLPLTEFKHGPKNPSRRMLRVTVTKSGNKTLRRAFVATARPLRGGSGVGNPYQIFERVGRARGPIRMLFGPSVPQMIGNKTVIQSIEERALQVMDQRFEHEINREMEKRLK